MRKKDTLLGMSFGCAAHRLRKELFFRLVVRVGENVCFRCGKEIGSARELSVDHKEAWEGATDPLATFMSVENIAYSHLACNSGAASRPYRIHTDLRARGRASDRKRREKKLADRKMWRQRRRAAGLPVT